MGKKFVAMEGPVFESEDKERTRIKVYLEAEDYEELCEIAEERDLTPAKLLSFILTDWASVD